VELIWVTKKNKLKICRRTKFGQFLEILMMLLFSIAIIAWVFNCSFAWVARNQAYPDRDLVTTNELLKQINEEPRLSVNANYIGPHLKSLNESYRIHFKCDDLFNAIISVERSSQVRCCF
jgi:hypothetical protein